MSWREAKAHAEREERQYQVQAWLVVLLALPTVIWLLCW